MGLELAKPVNFCAAMENDCKAISLGQKQMKEVVQSCMNQMKKIFIEVSRRAIVLDQTFSEHFGQTKARMPGSIVDNANPEGQRKRHQIVPQSFDPLQEELMPPHYVPKHDCRRTSVRSSRFALGQRKVARDGPEYGTHVLHLPRCLKGKVRFFCLGIETNPSVNPVRDMVGQRYSLLRELLAHRVLHQGVPDIILPATCAQPEGWSKPKSRVLFLLFSGAASCGYFEWKDEQHRQAISSSMPSSGSCGGDSGLPTCECSLISILLTCKSGVNKGRTFYKCPNPQGSQCNFFQWGS
ncbi:unnamed protein product [Peronospora belbahrii]|uniref:GRF-type domain-containing protein n=1 Tax=Peronospora belbahrii TaxID=622444 RepID=A0ABN8D5W1_9STRA|nr:unnamed protein product [Peronospora belbahrii]